MNAPRVTAPLDGAPWGARRVAGQWRRLATAEAPRTPLDPGAWDRLPVPARRWLRRATDAEPRTAMRAVIAMSERIRIGGWRSFTARQVIAAGTGYIWAATARFGPLPVLGYDAYCEGDAEMRWRLAGAIPVVTAAGGDVRRSAAGRLASEIVLTPGAAFSPVVRWEPADDAEAVAHVSVDGTEHAVRVHVDDAGLIRSVRLPRWGDPHGTGYALHEFTVRCTGDRLLGGYRLPAEVQAAWDVDAGGEPFIEFTIDDAAFA